MILSKIWLNCLICCSCRMRVDTSLPNVQMVPSPFVACHPISVSFNGEYFRTLGQRMVDDVSVVRLSTFDTVGKLFPGCFIPAV